MRYCIEAICNVEDFPAWAGGEEWLDVFTEQGEEVINYLNEYLDTWTESKNLTETEINDFLWFDAYELLVAEGLIDENDIYTNREIMGM